MTIFCSWLSFVILMSDVSGHYASQLVAYVLFYFLGKCLLLLLFLKKFQYSEFVLRNKSYVFLMFTVLSIQKLVSFNLGNFLILFL